MAQYSQNLWMPFRELEPLPLRGPLCCGGTVVNLKLAAIVLAAKLRDTTVIAIEKNARISTIKQETRLFIHSKVVVTADR